MTLWLALAMAAAGPAACPAPAVELAEPKGAFAARFASGSDARRKTESAARAAFKAACAKGLLRGDTIPKLSGVSAKRLFLENWPDANVASLESDQLRDGSWRLMLGYSFVASDGSVNVPTAAEIEEAIYCTVRGATEQEQAEIGRCLPD